MKFISPFIFQAFLTCHREAWLEYHSILSDQEHEVLSIGRLIHETAYKRERKEIFVDQLLKIDLLKEDLVAEVKKTSRHEEAAELQLSYYLFYLKHEKGLNFEGALLFPKERKRKKVILTPALERRIETLLREMQSILLAEKPPPKKRIRFCKSCSFREFCWAENQDNDVQ